MMKMRVTMVMLILLRYTAKCVSQSWVDDGGASTTLRGATSRVEVESPVQVTGLRLIDTSTSLPIRNLSNNDVINLSTLVSRTLTIEAITSSVENIKQVQFSYNAEPNFRKESFPPYVMCGNAGDRYRTCSIFNQVGKYTVTATPIAKDGIIGKNHTVTFDIIDETIGLVKTTCSIPKVRK